MTPRRISTVAFALAVVAAAALAFGPVTSTSSCSTFDGGSMCETRATSLMTSEGGGVLAVLALPVLAAALPMVVGASWARWVGAIALGLFCLAGMLTIGIFFAPAAAVALIAAARPPSESAAV